MIRIRFQACRQMEIPDIFYLFHMTLVTSLSNETVELQCKHSCKTPTQCPLWIIWCRDGLIDLSTVMLAGGSPSNSKRSYRLVICGWFRCTVSAVQGDCPSTTRCSLRCFETFKEFLNPVKLVCLKHWKLISLLWSSRWCWSKTTGSWLAWQSARNATHSMNWKRSSWYAPTLAKGIKYINCLIVKTNCISDDCTVSWFGRSCFFATPQILLQVTKTTCV